MNKQIKIDKNNNLLMTFFLLSIALFMLDYFVIDIPNYIISIISIVTGFLILKRNQLQDYKYNNLLSSKERGITVLLVIIIVFLITLFSQ